MKNNLREFDLKALSKSLGTKLYSNSGLIKNDLPVAVYSIGVSWLILTVIKLVTNVNASITDVLMLALLILIPVIVSKNSDLLKQIFKIQQEQSTVFWDYRVYKVGENPANVSPTIQISNESDVIELSKLGFDILYSEGENGQIVNLEKGMSVLNRIGWELIQVQRIGEYKYYYIFRRASKETIVN